MILAIDTCLPACSAALLRGEEVFARSEVIGTGHAERVAPMVAELLEEAGAKAAELARVCCTVGPGSFMGARVGISLAKGLALPRGLPTVGITTTEAVALERPRPLAVLIDARRGQAYAERFGDGAAPLALRAYDEARRLAEDCEATGVRLAGILGGEEREDAFPDPAAMARWAAGAAPARLRPLYLRPPDAKPSRAAL